MLNLLEKDRGVKDSKERMRSRPRVGIYTPYLCTRRFPRIEGGATEGQ